MKISPIRLVTIESMHTCEGNQWRTHRCRACARMVRRKWSRSCATRYKNCSKTARTSGKREIKFFQNWNRLFVCVHSCVAAAVAGCPDLWLHVLHAPRAYLLWCHRCGDRLDPVLPRIRPRFCTNQRAGSIGWSTAGSSFPVIAIAWCRIFLIRSTPQCSGPGSSAGAVFGKVSVQRNCRQSTFCLAGAWLTRPQKHTPSKPVQTHCTGPFTLARVRLGRANRQCPRHEIFIIDVRKHLIFQSTIIADIILERNQRQLRNFHAWYISSWHEIKIWVTWHPLFGYVIFSFVKTNIYG